MEGDNNQNLGGASEDPQNSATTDVTGGAGNQNQQNSQQSGQKTFTQDDVNAIGAREKNQGKSSILKLFGCSDEKTAKAEAEEFKKWKATQKTPEQIQAEAEAELKNTLSKSEQRAIIAENKLAAITAGVNPESVDDALAIASLRVTDEKPLDKVLAEMKKSSKYAGFFGTTQSNSTGTSAAHNQSTGGKENIGERLAKERTANVPKKSSFFNN